MLHVGEGKGEEGQPTIVGKLAWPNYLQTYTTKSIFRAVKVPKSPLKFTLIILPSIFLLLENVIE